eukprot:gnl/TRDRNA2_/TRDRNA2_29514_c0_seq1.p1 gnl/TRDRNA2_/TRDRNA2_29514_c0~~gnl/TRDRNA2_/TRDRNA2_29514_c0_seq1.p1  ORF type:complete len:511 (-),score=91.33 gnl/TRDRNA2_/TRDRNA2_29514_c0_seq1:88-1620(-)
MGVALQAPCASCAQIEKDLKQEKTPDPPPLERKVTEKGMKNNRPAPLDTTVCQQGRKSVHLMKEGLERRKSETIKDEDIQAVNGQVQYEWQKEDFEAEPESPQGSPKKPIKAFGGNGEDSPGANFVAEPESPAGRFGAIKKAWRDKQNSSHDEEDDDLRNSPVATDIQGRRISRVGEDDADIALALATMTLKPKKLMTFNRAMVRSRSRDSWEPIYQQPFCSRKFLETRLPLWTPVNVGQLIGFSSQKGGTPQIPNQDEYAVFHEAGYQVYLIIDGYGKDGEATAKFCRQWLVRELAKLVRDREDKVLVTGELSGVFAELHKAVSAEAHNGSKVCKDLFHSGCAATVAVVTPTRSMRGAWLGNCECIAGRRESKDGMQVLTPSHVLMPAPKAREAVKVSRAVGNLAEKAIGKDADEFVEADIDLSGVDFIVLGSGGLWRGVSKANVVEEIRKAGPYYAQHACSVLTTRSQAAQFASAFEAPVSMMGNVPPHLTVEDATVLVAWLGAITES